MLHILLRIETENQKNKPKTTEECKKFILEEWNSIPDRIIKNCGLNCQKRLAKIIELEGERLEPYHLKEIRKESKKSKYV